MKLPKIPYASLLLGPTALFFVGFLMNAIVISANGGQMPVLFPGGCPEDGFGRDIVHTCMTHATHLKFLADWILVNHRGIYSPGDFLELAFEATYMPALYMWAAVMIKDVITPSSTW